MHELFKRKSAVIFFVLFFLLATKALAVSDPITPQNFVDSSYPTLPQSHGVWNVKTDCSSEVSCYTDVQSAINIAAPGDEIILQAGSKFAGTLKLPAKTCSFSDTSQCWIIIRSSKSSLL